MNTPVLTDRYKNHRFPAEIISHAVWLYFRFCLSYRDVEELLFARGVTVSYEGSENGVASLASSTPISCAVDAPGRAISGTWMRSFSQFMGSGTISGGRWIRM